MTDKDCPSRWNDKYEIATLEITNPAMTDRAMVKVLPTPSEI
jgi:hypothetical protein